MYTYKMKGGAIGTIYTDKDIRAIKKAKTSQAISQKDFNDRIKLLNECMKSDTHNCRYCN